MNFESFADGGRVVSYDPHVVPAVPPLKTLVERHALGVTRQTTASEVAGIVGADRVRVAQILDRLVLDGKLARVTITKRHRGRTTIVIYYNATAVQGFYQP